MTFRDFGFAPCFEQSVFSSLFYVWQELYFIDVSHILHETPQHLQRCWKMACWDYGCALPFPTLCIFQSLSFLTSSLFRRCLSHSIWNTSTVREMYCPTRTDLQIAEMCSWWCHIFWINCFLQFSLFIRDLFNEKY